jgi:hypothetical protein
MARYRFMVSFQPTSVRGVTRAAEQNLNSLHI